MNDYIVSRGGYTVLEVMIFIAVSALMLIAAIAAVGGQQSKTQYAQGIRDLDSRIQDIINDVTVGYFPNQDVNCMVIGTGEIQLNSGSSSTGTNDECIFIGKAIQFEAAGSNSTKMNTFTLLGKRTTDGNNDVTSISEANPIAAAGQGGSTDLTDEELLRWGLRVTRVTNINGTADTALLGFFSGFARSSTTSTSLLAGSGSNVFAVRNFGINNTKSDAVAEIENFTDSDIAGASNGIIICIESANGNQKGSIQIGGKGRQLITATSPDHYPGVCP